MNLVSFVGWEPRFVCCVKHAIENYSVSKSSLLYSNEFMDWTKENLNIARKLFARKKIQFSETVIKFTDSKEKVYNKISEFCDELIKQDGEILLDITTMPREITWYILLHLCHKKLKVRFLYFQPEDYGDWLTEDATTPRLPLKLSGVANLSKKTLLIVITGFDVSRAEHLCNYFEPEKVILMLQDGIQYDNSSKNIDNHKPFADKINALVLPIDCYASDLGQQSIEEIIIKHRQDYNIIIASLGPKPSAISTFLLQRKYQDIALCYAPSKAINKEYSLGCKGCISEEINFI